MECYGLKAGYHVPGKCPTHCGIVLDQTFCKMEITNTLDFVWYGKPFSFNEINFTKFIKNYGAGGPARWR